MVSRAISQLLVLLCAQLLGVQFFLDVDLFSGRLTAGEAEESARVSSAGELLRRHCFACHGANESKADLRLDLLEKNSLQEADFKFDSDTAEKWQRVLEALRQKEMPPSDEKQPSDDERESLVKSIDAALQRYVDTSSVERPLQRKLTRGEYQNTMRDLLGIEMDFARDLPADPVSSDGFTNDSRLLELTPVHLEAYLESARNALRRVIVSQERPKEYHATFERSNVSSWHGETHISSELGRQQQFLAKMESAYPEHGDFLVRVCVEAELKPNFGYPLLEVAVGYRPDTEILFREFPLVEVAAPGERTYEFRGRIEDFPLPVRGQGKFPGLVVRVRNVYDDGSPLPKGSKGEDKKKFVYPAEPHLPLLHVKSVEFHGPIFDTWPPAHHVNIVMGAEKWEGHDSESRATKGHDSESRATKGQGSESRATKGQRADVRRVLAKFAQRAYRRPVTKVELRSLLRFYDEVKVDFAKFEDAIRETLAFVLIQPDFLYIPCADQTILEDEQTVAAGDWALASKLSYFLWSSMPDERLFDLASAGLLKQPETLQAEVERMLRDKKSTAFFEQFPDQWLALDLINNLEVSSEFYPQFNSALRTEMIGESRAFFAEMVRSNRGVQDFLVADFSMLNEPLARHYGIEGVLGTQFRPVKFPAEGHRGGLLGQAGFLLAGSTGADSHPVRRAVWIRDRLLNDPPPPPPANVPGLDAIDPKFHQLSMREKLAAHRQDPSCASCHRDLDPWGIALENFDAVGLWREEVRTKRGDTWEMSPIVANDTFSDGVELAGPEALKDRLACEFGEEFAKSVLVRMLTYALGRPMDVVDQMAVQKLEKQFAARGYRMRDLLQLIVASELFQRPTIASDQHDK